jgi:hypothetical protein
MEKIRGTGAEHNTNIAAIEHLNRCLSHLPEEMEYSEQMGWDGDVQLYSQEFDALNALDRAIVTMDQVNRITSYYARKRQALHAA